MKPFPFVILIITAIVFGGIFFYLFLPKNLPPQAVKSESISQQVEAKPVSIVSHSLTPVISNQWYSNVYHKFPTQPIYALPLAFQLSPTGIGFSLPDIEPSAKTIHASYVEDFTIGFDKALNKPHISTVGDWNVGLSMSTKDNRELSFMLAHGIPFTQIHTSVKEILISIPNGFEVFDNNNDTATTEKSLNTQSLLLTTRKHNYIIAFPKKTPITIGNKSLSLQNPQKIFVGILDDKKNYKAFQSISNSEIQGTTADFTQDSKTVTTNFHIVTYGKTPLIALYLHQYENLVEKPSILGTYQTIRGPMQLVSVKEFSTSIPKTVPNESFEKFSSQPKELIAQLLVDIQEVIKKKQPASNDYTLGTWFGKVTNLILLADSLGMEEEKQKLLKFVEPIFVESLNGFSYDKDQTSLIAKKPEFGNDKLNDHHFHYGYYILTAAVLTKYNPEILPDIQPSIQEMIGDIATTKRDTSKYPFLRNFDMYEGHSWADGYASFTDGNNQESSSEAINAWYSLYLWSKLTKNAELEKYALYLYNTEIQSTNYYWFDKKDIYQLPYKQKIASIVWGGKVEFNTWFSDEPNMKYGIELLPFTPASTYLGKLENFEKYDTDFHNNRGSETKPWGDLFVMWKSFYDPEGAMKLKDKVTKFEEANTKSLFLYFLYSNLEKAN